MKALRVAAIGIALTSGALLGERGAAADGARVVDGPSSSRRPRARAVCGDWSPAPRFAGVSRGETRVSQVTGVVLLARAEVVHHAGCLFRFAQLPAGTTTAFGAAESRAPGTASFRGCFSPLPKAR